MTETTTPEEGIGPEEEREEFHEPLTGRADVTIVVELDEVSSVTDALNMAANSIGRFGIDDHLTIVRDPESGREWVTRGGAIASLTEARANVEDLLDGQAQEPPGGYVDEYPKGPEPDDTEGEDDGDATE